MAIRRLLDLARRVRSRVEEFRSFVHLLRHSEPEPCLVVAWLALWPQEGGEGAIVRLARVASAGVVTCHGFEIRAVGPVGGGIDSCFIKPYATSPVSYYLQFDQDPYPTSGYVFALRRTRAEADALLPWTARSKKRATASTPSPLFPPN